MIDIESVGPGHLVDELACLMGHMMVLPDLSREHYERLPELIGRWWEHCERVVSPMALAARVSAMVLSLVSGAGESQGHLRLDVAQRALARDLR